MDLPKIQQMQTRLGVVPDGFWGPLSIAACQAHLRRLMPARHPWPKSDQASLMEFYGAPGDESQHMQLGVRGLGLLYDGRPVNVITCHRRVAMSLYTCLRNVRGLLDRKPGLPDVLAQYAGCYNNRAMRGGTAPSLHSRAAAIDLAPDDNGNRTSWPAAAHMPLEVMEIFAAEGWLSGGAFWGRDAMHFQATQ